MAYAVDPIWLKGANAYADSVRRIIVRNPFEYNDFIGLTIAGDRLSRIIPSFTYDDVVDLCPYAREAWKLYHEFLKTYKGQKPDTLKQDMESIWSDIYRHVRTIELDKEDQLTDIGNLLWEADSIISIACGAFRANLMTRDEVVDLYANLPDYVELINDDIIDLAQCAEDYNFIYHPDDLFPEAHLFWDKLAERSHSRLAKILASTAWERREQLLERSRIRFIDVFESPDVSGKIL